MRAEAALSPMARIAIAIAIGVVALLAPSCRGGGSVNRADWIDWTAPALP
jgi:hypothetical protein